MQEEEMYPNKMEGEPERKSLVGDAFAHQNEIFGALYEIIDSLEARLSPILVDQDTKAVEDSGVPKSSISNGEIAEKVDKATSKIQFSTKRIKDLVARLSI